MRKILRYPYFAVEDKEIRVDYIENTLTKYQWTFTRHKLRIFLKRILRREGNFRDFSFIDIYLYWKVALWSELRKEKHHNQILIFPGLGD